MRNDFFILALAIVGFADVSTAAEPLLGSAEYSASTERPFGWRGDGTGRFLGATPVTEWAKTKNVR